MLRHVGEQRSDTIDLELAAIMSATAGALNAVGFQVAGLFSANMTGNVSALAEHLAHWDWGAGLAFAMLVGTFIAGAILAASLIHLGEAKHLRAIYALVILLEGFLLLLLWAVIGNGAPAHERLSLIAALSFIMGLQNSTTTLISKARVRTTHVSGMATDIGIELAAMFAGSTARRLAMPKLKLHVATILCFAVGGVAGALVYAWVGSWLFCFAALILMAVAAPEAIRATLSE